MGDCEVSKGFDAWNAAITHGEDVWSADAQQDPSKTTNLASQDILRLRSVEFVSFVPFVQNDAPKTQPDSSVPTDVPTRTWSTSICELSDELILKYPLTISLEDYAGVEIVASWPEVEAWGSGTTDFEAINALKEEISSLYEEMMSSTDEELGKLPRRWKRALVSIISKRDAGNE